MAAAGADGYVILLDDKPLRLPGGAVLCLPGLALAEAVAEEWALAGGGAVGGAFDADALPLTRLAGTCQERVAPDRERCVSSLLGFVDGELLCYRASHPQSLVARQQAEWQPWLDWMAQHFAVSLVVTEGVMPIRQPDHAVSAVGRVLESQSDAVLTGLGVLVPALGSVVLALAVAMEALPPPDATRLALLDELDQMARWGSDAQTEARHLVLGRDVAEAARYMTLAAVSPA